MRLFETKDIEANRVNEELPRNHLRYVSISFSPYDRCLGHVKLIQLGMDRMADGMKAQPGLVNWHFV